MKHTVSVGLDQDGAVLAAGTVPWRVHAGALEVALVHRPHYDDWAWPKGKLDPGEDFPTAAARETLEETGSVAHLGRPLPSANYSVPTRGGERDKVVRYWAAQLGEGASALAHEVDDLTWLTPEQASARLNYEIDRDQLRALTAAYSRTTLDTRPLLLVRHAKAAPRRDWSESDSQRPLVDQGRARARALVPLLTAYGITSVITSPSVRCVDTITPYAVRAGLEVHAQPQWSEAGFAADPDRALRALTDVLAERRPTALCTHGPVLAALMEFLEAYVAADEPDSARTREQLAQSRTEGLDTGEVLVCHAPVAAAMAELVAVERHRG